MSRSNGGAEVREYILKHIGNFSPEIAMPKRRVGNIKSAENQIIPREKGNYEGEKSPSTKRHSYSGIGVWV